jgi:hypothetical protein
MKMSIQAILLTVAAAFFLSACGERQQVIEQCSEKRYQGKRDGKPWENEPLAYGSGKWSKGDRAAWETQIKARQLGQHEDKRIYQ